MRLFKAMLVAILTAIVVFAVAIVVAWKFLRYAGPISGTLPPYSVPSLFSPADTITIWLALLGALVALSTLVVTTTGLMIGALAIIAYETFRTEVQGRATEAAITQINK
jgi:hypothetical protein